MANEAKTQTITLAPRFLTHDEFLPRLSHFYELWNTSRGRDYQLRLQTGYLINRRLGALQTQRARCEVIERVAEELDFTQDEIEKMRGMAYTENFALQEYLRRRRPHTIDTCPLHHGSAADCAAVGADPVDQQPSLDHDGFFLRGTDRVEGFVGGVRDEILDAVSSLDKQEILFLSDKLHEIAGEVDLHLRSRACGLILDEEVVEPLPRFTEEE